MPLDAFEFDGMVERRNASQINAGPGKLRLGSAYLRIHLFTEPGSELDRVPAHPVNALSARQYPDLSQWLRRT